MGKSGREGVADGKLTAVEDKPAGSQYMQDVVSYPNYNFNNEDWIYSDEFCARLHYPPRLTLFRSASVPRSSSAGSPLSLPITTGRFNEGESNFRVSDCWRTQSQYQLEPEKQWTGYTIFFFERTAGEDTKFFGDILRFCT